MLLFLAVQHVLGFIEQRFGDQCLVLTSHEPAPFLLKLLDEDLPAIHRVADRYPKIVLAAFQTLFARLLPYLFGGKGAFGDGSKHPLHNIRFWGLWSNEFSTIFPNAVDIPNRCATHPAAFLFGPAHSMEHIQGPPVVLHLWCSQVESQHHLVLGNGQVQRLLYGLRLDAKLSEDIDHLVGVSRIPAETIPFREQHQVGFPFLSMQALQKRRPCRPVKGLGRMVLQYNFSNRYGIDLTIPAQHLLLVALTIPLFCLFVCRHPDVQICDFHK
ncbi:MAG TPA: hypothetical protein VHE34_10545 [Puia sp.]|nr:hypothetical protein [Puia sp.]HVU95655.1 hypothetical protein [Puia sp.]